jgi:predicted translin family RNA/ssDNA-binding protein
VVTELNAKMLEFDFRNGPLRRKYDGLKYAVRNIEDILFELSLQQGPGSGDSNTNTHTHTDEAVASPTKRMRLGEAGTEESAVSVDAAVSGYRYLDSDEIDAIRARMDEYDQQRELVIKDARDVQKLAKQGVYAVIRGQLQEAQKKLDLAAKCADKIMLTVAQVPCGCCLWLLPVAFACDCCHIWSGPDSVTRCTVHGTGYSPITKSSILAVVCFRQQPTLRHGGFSNSLEEWAEGAITLEWAAHKRIPSREELRLVNANEYVGALADFTGEIGRLAVMHAGKRDFAAVKDIYQAELVVSGAISRLSGNRFGKKLEMVNQNAKKVGDVIYELTMLQRSGRSTRTKPADPSAAPAAGDGKTDGAED